MAQARASGGKGDPQDRPERIPPENRKSRVFARCAGTPPGVETWSPADDHRVDCGEAAPMVLSLAFKRLRRKGFCASSRPASDRLRVVALGFRSRSEESGGRFNRVSH